MVISNALDDILKSYSFDIDPPFIKISAPKYFAVSMIFIFWGKFLMKKKDSKIKNNSQMLRLDFQISTPSIYREPKLCFIFEQETPNFL